VPNRADTGTINHQRTFAERIQENVMSNNPKTDTSSNTQKDPDDWVRGDEPMTGAQRSYLKTLSEQAH